MTRFLIPITGLLMLAGSGVLHGVQTGRWHKSDALAKAAAALDNVPTSVDTWQGRQLEISDRELTIAEAAGGAALSYQNTRPDSSTWSQTVEVMLLCGPHGPISLHPPTVCFRGAGYNQCSAVRSVQVKDDQGNVLGTFFSTDFERSVDGMPERIRTWWGWSTDGTWSAPENARIAFAGSPFLYKLYLTERGVQDGQDSAIPDFARLLLPELRTDVFGADQTSDAT